MSKQPLTTLQRKILFAELHHTASDLGCDAEAYRKRVMLECCGVEHLGEVSRTEGFDKMMCRILQDRGDYARASEFILGDLTRLRHLCQETAESICAASAYRGSAFDYIAGVMIQAGYLPAYANRATVAQRLVNESGWEDLPMDRIKRVLMMLQAQLKRIRNRGAA